MGYLGLPDDTNPKFTGQERDPETADPTTPSSGLDWFNVRYLSSAQGRFQGPDPGNAGADPGNPQTWNGFAYVGNNPMSYTDPSGMVAEADGGGDGDGGDIFGLIVAGIADLLEDIFGGGGHQAPPPELPSARAQFWDLWAASPVWAETGWPTAAPR
jgi:RHS repeat-associated protein